MNPVQVPSGKPIRPGNAGEAPMKRISILIVGICLSISDSPSQARADAYWMAKARWYFSKLATTRAYRGLGHTREQALRDARNRCLLGQVGPWTGYCQTEPSRVDYTELADCGMNWSDWKEMVQGLGNPCPPNCFRGAKLSTQIRLGGVPIRPQRREKVQCWRKK